MRTKHWRKGVTPSNFQIKCLCQCLYCGQPSRVKSKRTSEKHPLDFCSTSCQVKWQNENTNFNKGDRNPSYRHGQRVDGRYPDYGPDFTSQLKRDIKIRDGYNCNKCSENFSGKKSKFLDVHHIDEDKNNNDSNNLISLCKSCHTKVHWEELKKGELK